MLFFYLRHGDPVYDSLTPLGERQAEALGKRLAMYGIDRIYSSPLKRAMLTAKPTCELLKKEIEACQLMKKEIEVVEFANERAAWGEIAIVKDGVRKWLFHDEETKQLMADESVISLGHNWLEHNEFQKYKEGFERISRETTEFFKGLGYEHIKNTGKYKVLKSNNERVALFAHQGFGIAFLSELLDIPYPIFANHFDICHSGMTVIEFKEVDGYAIPKVLTLSSDSHIYRDGLPTKYNNELYF